jgi:HNH endonuclease
MAKELVSFKQRRKVRERADGCCEYCRSQERFAMQPFSAEHIRSRSQGGETHLRNLAWACQGCNNHKYNKSTARDPLTGEIVPLFHPRRQRWADHFAWNEDGTLVLGLSPVGRATVEALHLNRSGLVNLRRILFAVQEHRPEGT